MCKLLLRRNDRPNSLLWSDKHVNGQKMSDVWLLFSALLFAFTTEQNNACVCIYMYMYMYMYGMWIDVILFI